MYFRNHIPLLKFFGTCIVPVLYIVGFATKYWVISDTMGWGLWNWCYTNFTDLDNPLDYVNDTHRCHVIAPGDSPGYFEVVRVIACLALVVFVAFFFTIGENKHLGQGNRPTAVAIAAASLATMAMVLLASTYSGDKRWEHANPSLGWSFAVVAVSAALSLCMGPVFWKAEEIRKETPYLASPGAVLPSLQLATGYGDSSDACHVPAADNDRKESGPCEEPDNPHTHIDIGGCPQDSEEQRSPPIHTDNDQRLSDRGKQCNPRTDSGEDDHPPDRTGKSYPPIHTGDDERPPDRTGQHNPRTDIEGDD